MTVQGGASSGNLREGASSGVLYSNEWTPRQLDGCTIWLRADVGVTLISGNVSAWADQSGIGYSAAQATSANRPGWNASGLNGLPYLSFDGSAQNLIVTGPNVSPTDWLIFAVIDDASGAGAGHFVWSDFDGTSIWCVASCDQQFNTSVGYTTDGSAYRIGPASAVGTAALVWDLRASPGGNIYKNRALGNVSPLAYTQRGIDASTNTRIGSFPTAGVDLFHGKLYEFGMIKAPSDTKRLQIDSYLFGRYGL